VVVSGPTFSEAERRLNGHLLTQPEWQHNGTAWSECTRPGCNMGMTITLLAWDPFEGSAAVYNCAAPVADCPTQEGK
jgi:hypothetical protein